MNRVVAPLGFAGIAGLLIEIASRDLSSLDGAFGLTGSEWSVVCMIGGVLFAALASWHSRAARTNSTPDSTPPQ